MKYEREILVPYLKSLYQLEFVKMVLNSKYNSYNANIQSLTNDIEYAEKNNRLPMLEKQSGKAGKVISGIFSELGSNAIMLDLSLALIGVGLVLGPLSLTSGIIMIGMGVMVLVGRIAILLRGELKKVQMYEDSLREQYEKKLEKLEERNKRAEQCRSLLPKYKKKMSVCKTEYAKVSKELSGAYSLDIIPNQYRDISSIAYLYDYFSSSKANDLDMIIQTLLLENIQSEIKKLRVQIDRLIKNQEELLYKMEQMQMEAKKIEEIGNQQLTLLAKQEENHELQNQYLQMIECNTSANAYLGAATYMQFFR